MTDDYMERRPSVRVVCGVKGTRSDRGHMENGPSRDEMLSCFGLLGSHGGHCHHPKPSAPKELNCYIQLCNFVNCKFWKRERERERRVTLTEGGEAFVAATRGSYIDLLCILWTD